MPNTSRNMNPKLVASSHGAVQGRASRQQPPAVAVASVHSPYGRCSCQSGLIFSWVQDEPGHGR
jgi:hypothetical protein